MVLRCDPRIPEPAVCSAHDATHVLPVVYVAFFVYSKRTNAVGYHFFMAFHGRCCDGNGGLGRARDGLIINMHPQFHLVHNSIECPVLLAGSVS